MTRAVVFDFDGVLADTETMHLAAFQEVFRGRGWTLERDAYFDRYLGFDDRDLVAAFAKDSGLVLAAADLRHVVEEKTRTYEQRLIDGRVTYPTAAPAIARLGIPLRPRHRLGIARRRNHGDSAAGWPRRRLRRDCRRRQRRAKQAGP